MNLDLVETFLAIQEHSNITAAAHALYVSQSTVSHRLAQLETEVGTTLFARRKGQRFVDLTPAGEEFFPVAQRWIALLRDTDTIGQRGQRTTLTVGAPDLVNSYTFVDLYRSFLQANPLVRLNLKTYHSGELYRMLGTRELDIAYVFSRVRVPDVVVRPLFQEPFYALVRHGAASGPVHAQDLPASEEVYLRWNSEYEIWHDRYWEPGAGRLTVDVGNQLALYLGVAERWALAPASIATRACAEGKLDALELVETTPRLHYYEITHRHPRPRAEAVIESFRAAVEKHVSSLVPTTT